MAKKTKDTRDKITSYRLSQKVVQRYLESVFVGLYDFQLHVRSLESLENCMV
jgi:hypothetical protein